MSLIFTHYDRTQLCTHEGMLGKAAKDGSRICIRCGRTVRDESFTEPAGQKSGRQTESTTLR